MVPGSDGRSGDPSGYRTRSASKVSNTIELRRVGLLGPLGIAMGDVMILYRPVGPKELALIEASGRSAFPPRLPEQPIFYPVLNEEYAAWISERWNVRDYGSGYVTRFAVRAEFASRYPTRRVGAGHAEELWVPAEDLDELNRNIVGPIEVIAEFHA